MNLGSVLKYALIQFGAAIVIINSNSGLLRGAALLAFCLSMIHLYRE